MIIVKRVNFIVFLVEINCLKTVMSTNQEISPECKTKLKERLEMYKNAAQVVSIYLSCSSSVRSRLNVLLVFVFKRFSID